MNTCNCVLINSIITVDNPIILITFAMCGLIILNIIIFLERKYLNLSDINNYKEDLYYSLGYNLEDAFFVYDMIEQKFEYISPNFEKIFGISSSMLERNLFLLFDFIDLKQKEILNITLSPGSIHGYQETEFTYYHPISKQEIRFKLKIYPIYKFKDINRIIICIKDITEEYLAKTAIREELSVTKKANEAKKDFLSHMSHELKTPISAILGMTQIASNSLDNPEKVMDCLDKINYSSRNLLLLIDNILENVKLDNDKLLLIREPFYLSKTLSAFSSLIQVQAEIKHQKYNFIMSKIQHDYIIGDSLRLTQILNNCLYNSLKFTPSGGEIKLEVMELVAKEKRCIFRFIITDSGKGMHDKFLDQIFNAYVQEDESISETYGGSGLGMSIVKNLLALMEGEIHVESQVGKGTRITIDIGFDFISDTNEDKPQPYHTDLHRNAHILIVEDNEINLEITCEFLKMLHLEYDTAISGEEAVELFRASPENYYDIILMDIQMPAVDGFEATKKLRSLTRTDAGKVQIIALSADNSMHELCCTRNGMNGYITKPVDIAKLSAIIQDIRCTKK